MTEPTRGSTAQYARHRRAKGLHGVSRQSVENALADGRITRDPKDNKIVFAQADADWEKNTDPTRHAPKRNSDALSKSKEKKAEYDARTAQLDFERKSGELVRVKDVERQWFDLCRRTRDRLMSLPARVAAVVAAESSAREVEQILEAEMREALEALDENTTNGKGD